MFTKRCICPAVLVALAGSAHAQTLWNNAAGGLWHTAANWNPVDVPNSAAEFAEISLGGTYAVEHNLSTTIGGVSILNATATLNINNNTTLTMAGGGTATNAGVIIINSNSAGNVTQLVFSADTTLSGAGSVGLNATGGALDRAILQTSGGTLTNASGHTIRGRGNVYGAVNNQGTMRADFANEILQLFSQAKSNSGIMEAVSDATLQINGITITQTNTGQIRADGIGSEVYLLSATVSGGSVRGNNSGVVRSISGTNTLTNVRVVGTLNIDNNTTISASGLRNDGTMTVNWNSAGNVTQLVINQTGTIIGTGTIALNAVGGVLDRSFFQTVDGVTATLGGGQTLRGRGNVYAAIVNDGLIRADMPGEFIQFLSRAKTNNTTAEAVGGAFLQVNGITLTQDADAQLRADGAGSEVRLSSATIAGGNVLSQNGGLVRTIAGTNVLSGVHVDGAVNIDNNTLIRAADLTNDAVITVNAQSAGNATHLTITQTGTIGGTGEIVLNAVGGVLDRAFFQTDADVTATLGGGQTLRGRGNVYASLVSDGLIRADMPGEFIQFLGSPKTNNTTAEAVGGAFLQVNGITLTQDADAQLRADGAGSEVRLSSATIAGGNVLSQNGGLVRTIAGTNVLTGVRVDGAVNIDNNTAIRADNLTNDAVITVNAQSAGNATHLTLTQTGTIGGTGEIVLNAVGGVLDRAFFQTDAGVTATLGSGQTLRGRGNVYAALVNEGEVRADFADEFIQFLSSPKTNNNRIASTGSAILQINGITVTQGPAGRLECDGAGSDFFLVNATVRNGAMNIVNGGNAFRTTSGTNTLDSVDLNGPLGVDNNTALVLRSVNNDGAITVNTQSAGNVTHLDVVENTTITGNGRVILNAVGGVFDRAYIHSNAATWTHGPGQRLEGNGHIYGTHIHQGTIAPGMSVGTLRGNGNASITMADSSVLEIEIVSTGSFDRVDGNGLRAVDGTVRVTTDPAYSPQLGHEFAIISGTTRTGTFDTLDAPANVPQGLKWGLDHQSDRVVLRVTCKSDTNSDGFVNGLDFDDFVTIFEAGDIAADFDGDGFVTGLDFDAYVSSFEGGC